MNSLLESIKTNGLFVLEFLGIVVGVFLVAYLFERIALSKKKKDDKSGKKEKILTTRKMVVTGMFAAIATVLFLFDFPVLFAPVFYKLDFSELPALIVSFAYGPVAGVLVEFVKILLKILIKGTDSAFVGELANFVVGSALILPAGIIYYFKKTKKTAIVACIAGTLFITVAGTVFNAVYLLPAFAKLYGMPLDAIIAMGSEINGRITGIWSFVLLCVAPLNLIKGALISIVTMLIYKPLRKVI